MITTELKYGCSQAHGLWNNMDNQVKCTAEKNNITTAAVDQSVHKNSGAFFDFIARMYKEKICRGKEKPVAASKQFNKQLTGSY